MELNIYGVNKAATDMWVKVIDPLQLAPAEEALLMSEANATTLASDLTISEGVAFAKGRPKDRQPHH